MSTSSAFAYKLQEFAPTLYVLPYHSSQWYDPSDEAIVWLSPVRKSGRPFEKLAVQPQGDKFQLGYWVERGHEDASVADEVSLMAGAWRWQSVADRMLMGVFDERAREAHKVAAVPLFVEVSDRTKGDMARFVYDTQLELDHASSDEVKNFGKRHRTFVISKP